MNMIVAADRNWGIGKGGSLLVSIPADMKLFRSQTEGKVVVMGRRTLESLPGGLPLKGRINIVLSSNPSFKAAGAVICNNVEALLQEIRKYPPEDVFCIGGESLYKMLLPYTGTVYVTRIDFSFQADRFFPNLDVSSDFILTEESEEHTYFDLEYRFAKYERRK